MENPLFSIIVPTHNRPQYIARAVNSILAQSVKNYEIIVIDDASRLSYEDFTSAYREKIIYIRNSVAKGVSSSRNIGISVASGSWLVFLDDDDEFTPNYLKLLSEKIPSRENCFIWCSVEFRQLGISGEVSFYRRYPLHYASQLELYKDALSIGASFGLAINKNFLLGIGLFDPSYPVAEDTELIVRLLSKGATPHAIHEVGVIKHEEHEDRLTKGFSLYSEKNIYERIFLQHQAFFKKNPFHYKWMLDWALDVHIMSNNITSAKHTIFDMFRMGFFINFIKGFKKMMQHCYPFK